MRNLDITTLRALVAVADHGGVTRAAAILHLTQSAVSMQIKRLEEMLDLALFDRGNRRVSLTGPGEQLVSYARRILALNDEAVARLTEDRYEGELRMTSSTRWCRACSNSSTPPIRGSTCTCVRRAR